MGFHLSLGECISHRPWVQDLAVGRKVGIVRERTYSSYLALRGGVVWKRMRLRKAMLFPLSPQVMVRFGLCDLLEWFRA